MNYSSSTLIYASGIALFVLSCIYFYYYYKSVKQALTATQAQRIAQCPDYWNSIGKGVCQNAYKLGSCANTIGNDVIDFSGEIFTNMNTGNYGRCKFAKGCNISWSGIDRIC